MIAVWVVAAVVCLVAICHLVIPAVVKIVHRRAFLRRVAAAGGVHLTFDDGPDPRSTPAILDLLAAEDVRAAFFVVGEAAEEHPDLVRRIVAEGHQVGSHGYDHSHAWRVPPWRTRADLVKGHETLQACVANTGQSELLFRPPYGKLNAGSLPHLSAATTWWNVDPEDYARSTGGEVIERLDGEVGNGSVILLHDGRRGGGDPSVTVDAVAALLAYADANDLRFSPIPTSG